MISATHLLKHVIGCFGLCSQHLRRCHLDPCNPDASWFPGAQALWTMILPPVRYMANGNRIHNDPFLKRMAQPEDRTFRALSLSHTQTCCFASALVWLPPRTPGCNALWAVASGTRLADRCTKRRWPRPAHSAVEGPAAGQLGVLRDHKSALDWPRLQGRRCGSAAC